MATIRSVRVQSISILIAALVGVAGGAMFFAPPAATLRRVLAQVAPAAPQSPPAARTQSASRSAAGTQPIGTIEGVFSVDANGAATYQIDLEVPPGTNNVAPDLSLTYHSQRDNGMVGMGWALNGIDSIARCNAALVPNGFTGAVNFDANDRFCLGGMPLLAVSGTYGADGTEYRTVRDTWTKVVSKGICGAGPCWFSAQNKDGATLRFGYTAGTSGSRVLAAGRNDGAVRVWSLDRYTDNNGNYTAVSYYNNSATAEYYPVRIDYTGNDRMGFAPQRSVQFLFAPRSDRISGYTGGSPWLITSRLTNVKTYVGSTLVTNYAIGYTYGNATFRSRVASVQRCTADTPSATTCFPATTFAASDPANGLTTGGTLATGIDAGSTLGIIPMDVNGDGRTDVVQPYSGSNLNAAVYLSNGTSLSPGTSQNLGIGVPGQGILGMDVNGDGLGDLVAASDDGGNLKLASFISTAGTFAGAINTNTGQGAAHLAFLPMDVTADGVEDVVQVIDDGGNVTFRMYPSNHDGTFGAAVVTKTSQSKDNWGFLPLDVNGDGRVDIVQPRTTNNSLDFVVYYSTTSGFGGGSITPTGSNPPKPDVTAGDFNGDSKADLLVLDAGTANITVIPYLGTGAGFRQTTATTVQGGDSNIAVMVANLNGDGRADLLQALKVSGQIGFVPYYSNGLSFQKGATVQTTASVATLGMRTFDVDGDGKQDVLNPQNVSGSVSFALFADTTGQADLVTAVTNGIGGTVTATFKPLTDPTVYTKGSGAQYPVRDEISSMPVVASYVNGDGRGGNYTYTYKYEQGRVGFTGIGWLGFRYMTMTDAADGRYSVVTYDQTWPSNGGVTQSAVYDANGVMLSRTSHTYADIASSALAQANIHQFVRTAEQLTQFEIGGAEAYRLRKEYGYDAFGNANLVSDLGQVGVTGDEVYTCVLYSNDAANWRIGYGTGQKITKTLGACQSFLAGGASGFDPANDLQWTKHTFDARMNPASSSTWDDSNSVWLTMAFTVDDYGNRVSITDAGNNTTTIAFETAYNTFPSTITSPPNEAGARLVDTYTYEAAFGNLLTNTDPNDNVFRWDVDAFGRVIDEYGPDPSGASKRVRHLSWDSDTNGTFTRESSRPAWDASDDVTTWTWDKTYLDGMEREYRTETRGATASTTVVNELAFDAEGQVSKRSLPHFIHDAPQWVVTAYDVMNRPTTTTQPDGTVEKISYELGGLKFYRTAAFGTPDAATEIVTANAHGLVTSRIFPNNEIYRYTYSLLGNVLQIDTLPDRRTVAMTYDSVQRLRTVNTPDSGTTTFGFDTAGNNSGVTDADGNTIVYQYDALGRITKATKTAGGDVNVTDYTYDGSTANGRGNLTNVSMTRQPLGAYSFDLGYDASRQTTAVRVTLPGRTYSYGMTYNPNGQMQTETYPDGASLAVTYGIDAYPRTLSLTPPGGTAQTYVTFASYDPFGTPLDVTYRNGVKTTRAFYPQNVSTGKIKTVTATSGSSTLFGQQLEWNRVDSVTKITDLVNTPGLTKTFGYDASHMSYLTSAQGADGGKTFQYDRVANRTKADDVTYTYTANTNKLASSSDGTAYGWNNNGTLKTITAGGVTTAFTYDADGRLLKAAKSGMSRTANMAYDFAGNRLFEQPIDRDVTIYRVNDDFEVDVYGNGTTLNTKYIHGVYGAAVAITTNGSTAAARAAVAANNHHIGQRLHGGGGSVAGDARAMAHRFVAFIATTDFAAPAVFAFLAIALLLALMPPFRARAATMYGRRQPLFARIAPVILAAFVIAIAAPASAGLAPGTNGAGNPVVGTRYFIQDFMNSTVAVTDESANRTASVSYLPYGGIDQANSSGTDDFRPKFNGQSFDSGLGLYHFQDRYYDPATGRFTTPDPMAQFINPYAYALDNPYSLVDPNGDFLFLIAIVVGAVVGAYMGAAAVNHDYNPAHWDWKSGKTYAGLLGGAAIGAVGGVIVEVAAGTGVAAGIAGAVLVGAGENAAYTAMGGGSAKDVLISAAEGAAFGFLFGAAGAALGRLAARFGSRGAGAALSEAAEAGEARLARGFADACASFLAGQKVVTAEGLAPIETIQAGEHVLGWDKEAGSTGAFIVTATIGGTTDTVTRVTTASGSVIESTPAHRIYVADMGWIAAEQLHPGLQLVDPEGNRIAIRSVETEALPEPRPVYNLAVDTVHNYYLSADRVLVKNPESACLLAKGIKRPHFRKATKDAVFARQTIKSGVGKGMVKSAVSNQRLLRLAKVWIGKSNPRQISAWQLDHITPYRFLLQAARRTKVKITWEMMADISNFADNLRYVTINENVSHAYEPSASQGLKDAIAIFKKHGLWK